MAGRSVGYRLGIDLGTTFTAAAVERDGLVRMVSLGLRQPEIPSVLAIRDGETLVGDIAERLAVARPEIMAREFKRRIGDPTAMIIDGTPWTAEALTGRLLGFVLDEVKRVEGEPPVEVVLTHPANWGEFKLDRLRQAMLLAGCEQGTLMAEPVAAARYYASQGRVSDGQVLAVFDFGGGTFDAAVVESVKGELRVIGQPKGLERLGGIDLDQAVLDHVLHHGEVDLRDLDDTASNRQAVGRLRQDCRDAKETLSSDTAAIVPVMLPGVHSEVRITRSEFERLIREPLFDAITVVRSVIGSAQLDPADIDAFLLVGGSSRIPYVAQMIGEELARPALTDAHPKHTIVQGAVVGQDARPVVRLEPEQPIHADPPTAAGATADALSGGAPIQPDETKPIEDEVVEAPSSGDRLRVDSQFARTAAPFEAPGSDDPDLLTIDWPQPSGDSGTNWFTTRARFAVLAAVGIAITIAGLFATSSYRTRSDAPGLSATETVSTPIHSLDGHTALIWAVDYGPTGTRVATASADKSGKIWDAESGELLHTLDGHTDLLEDVQFSPDGTLIVTAGRDDTAKIWDTATGDLVATLNGHTNAVASIRFNARGNQLAVASADKTATIWDLVNRELLHTLDGHAGIVWFADFSPDGTLVATASDDGTVKIWSSATGEVVHTLDDHAGSVWYVSFSPDGTRLASTSDDATVKIWDVATGKLLHTLKGHSDAIWLAEFSPDGSQLASTSRDGSARIWDATTGDLLHILSGHRLPVTTGGFSPDSTQFATASQDSTVKIWDTATGHLLRNLDGHSATVVSVSFSPDGSRLATSSDDASAKIWAVGQS